MSIFRNERFLRVVRPAATILGLGAAIWHSTHALSMWSQTQQYKTSDPALSGFFWSKFQLELGVTIAAFFAGIFAWHLFTPRPKTGT
jgi:hypothetical protein